MLRLTLTVSNLEQSERFLQALDFSVAERRRFEGDSWARLLALSDPVLRVSALRLGDESIELREFESPDAVESPRALPSNVLSFQHMAIVVSDMQAAYRRVRSLGVHEVSQGPQTLPLSNPAAGGIQAFYFRDSDWHALELIQFPPGKGDTRWQKAKRGLFLGIDHTAIVVRDTDISAPMYAELGFGVSGRSLNFGREQELLSGVPGARVRITGFAARSGPGVEFLSYLEPGLEGIRAETRPSDLGHWEITVQVPDIERALDSVERRGGTRLSSGIVDMRDSELGYEKAVVVQDRDGHGLKLVQP